MSVLIKSLTIGLPVIDTQQDAGADLFNLLNTANAIYDLYVAPSEAIVKSIRIMNTHPTAIVKVTLFWNSPNPNGMNSRRRRLTPLDMQMQPNSVYVDDSEITLQAGNKIQAKTDTGGVVQYLISGIERAAS